MGRFALQFENGDKARDKDGKSLASAVMSFLRLFVVTTSLAYLIVLGWMWITGDQTLWRLLRILR